jgi:hypothetical protein
MLLLPKSSFLTHRGVNCRLKPGAVEIKGRTLRNKPALFRVVRSRDLIRPHPSLFQIKPWNLESKFTALDCFAGR